MTDLRKGIACTISDAVVTVFGGSVKAVVLLHYDSRRPDTITVHHGALAEPVPRYLLREGMRGAITEVGGTRRYHAWPIDASYMLVELTSDDGIIKVTLPVRPVDEFLADCVAEDGKNAEVDLLFFDLEREAAALTGDELPVSAPVPTSARELAIDPRFTADPDGLRNRLIADLSRRLDPDKAHDEADRLLADARLARDGRPS